MQRGHTRKRRCAVQLCFKDTALPEVSSVKDEKSEKGKKTRENSAASKQRTSRGTLLCARHTADAFH
jgi:hypothetical protein